MRLTLKDLELIFEGLGDLDESYLGKHPEQAALTCVQTKIYKELQRRKNKQAPPDGQEGPDSL